MERTTLKYLRILIPGLIIILGIFPIFEFKFSEILDLKTLDTTYVTFLSILLGSIYYQLDIQQYINKPSRHFIHRNILKKLIIASKLTIDKNQESLLKEHPKSGKDNSQFMITFYNVIDGDKSLKAKSKNVLFNGIFWTSTADLVIISLTFSIIYYFFFKTIPNYLVYQKLFITFALLGLILHIISVKKHIKLSNKQLNSIIQQKNLSEIVKKEFSEYLKEK